DHAHARQRPALQRRAAAPARRARGVPAARRRLHLEVRPCAARGHPPGPHARAGRPVGGVARHRLPDPARSWRAVRRAVGGNRQAHGRGAAGGAAGRRAGRRPHRSRRPAGALPVPSARVPHVMSRTAGTLALVFVAVWVIAHVLAIGPVQEAAEVTLIWVVGFVAICLLIAALVLLGVAMALGESRPVWLRFMRLARSVAATLGCGLIVIGLLHYRD